MLNLNSNKEMNKQWTPEWAVGEVWSESTVSASLLADFKLIRKADSLLLDLYFVTVIFGYFSGIFLIVDLYFLTVIFGYFQELTITLIYAFKFLYLYVPLLGLGWTLIYYFAMR